MDLFHHNKNECNQCHEKFTSYNELIEHMKVIHRSNIIKCHECGKEFLHEKDRLHHIREEKEKEYDHRIHKDEYKHNISSQNTDERIKNFGDNF